MSNNNQQFDVMKWLEMRGQFMRDPFSLSDDEMRELKMMDKEAEKIQTEEAKRIKHYTFKQWKRMMDIENKDQGKLL